MAIGKPSGTKSEFENMVRTESYLGCGTKEPNPKLQEYGADEILRLQLSGDIIAYHENMLRTNSRPRKRDRKRRKGRLLSRPFRPWPLI